MALRAKFRLNNLKLSQGVWVLVIFWIFGLRLVGVSPLMRGF
jgi:hypothetical protein